MSSSSNKTIKRQAKVSRQNTEFPIKRGGSLKNFWFWAMLIILVLCFIGIWSISRNSKSLSSDKDAKITTLEENIKAKDFTIRSLQQQTDKSANDVVDLKKEIEAIKEIALEKCLEVAKKHYRYVTPVAFDMSEAKIWVPLINDARTRYNSERFECYTNFD